MLYEFSCVFNVSNIVYKAESTGRKSRNIESSFYKNNLIEIIFVTLT